MAIVILTILYFFIGLRAMEMYDDIKASELERRGVLIPIPIEESTSEWDESFVDGLR